MKKILCLILALLMLVSVVSCGPSSQNDPEGSTENTTDAPTSDEITTDDPSATTEADATTEAATTEEVSTEPEVDPDEGITFQTGYSRVVITPPEEVMELKGLTKVKDDIYATCLAMYDGEKTALFISLDMQDLMPDKNDQIKNKINTVTKVPKENIFIAVTHDHSSVNFGTESVWTFNTCKSIANCAQEAIDDLSTSKMFVGTGDTTGAAFVRRYVMADGSKTSIWPGEGGAVKCVSEADASLQVVRFVREDKKDVVLLNWQGHLAHAIAEFPTSLSADITHYLREDIEKGDEDTQVIFFAGASGNLNLNAPNKASQKYESYIQVARAVAKEALNVMNGDMQRIKAGTINIIREVHSTKNADDPEDVIAAAQNRINAGTGDHQDDAIVARNRNDYSDLRLGALSIGDLAFVTAPYEMFDTNGMEIKEGSPFKMTIIVTNSDGAWAYVPSDEAFTEYGGYETEKTYFFAGIAEELVAEYLRMLNELSEIK